jgi:hypothetical protein
MAPTKILSINFIAILFFTLMYFTLSKTGEDHFSGLDKESSLLDHLYFTSTIQSTVGFGDIYPKSAMAKIMVIAQQSIIILGILELISEVGIPRALKKMI